MKDYRLRGVSEQGTGENILTQESGRKMEKIEP
jgi:hypothetical protein